MPRVSVIMNGRNVERFLAPAIESVFAQTFGDWEIVLWDNASGDGTAEVARRYEPRLRYFRGDHYLPLGAARNRAMADARGEFVAFLDCDDLWHPEKLAEQVARLDAPDRPALVYCDCVMADERLVEFNRWFRRAAPAADAFFGLLSRRNFIQCTTVVARRDVLLSLGGFTPDLNHAEDYDMWVRVAREHPIAFVPKALATWRLHGANETGMGNPATTAEVIWVMRQALAGARLSLRQRAAVLARKAVVRARFIELYWKRRDLRNLLRRGLLGSLDGMTPASSSASLSGGAS